MTKAIEDIAAAYVTLKDHVALEQIRDHRRKLLNETRMRDGGPFRLDWLSAELQEEIGIVDAALDKLRNDQGLT